MLNLEIHKLRDEDLQLNNQWFCSFPELSKASFMLKDISIPLEKLVTETKKFGDKKYTGFTPVEDITMTFFENTKFEIYEFFYDWYSDIFDTRTKRFKVLTDENQKYKDLIITFYSNGNLISRVPTFAFTLRKTQILGVDSISLNQEGGTAFEWSVQVTPEKVVPVWYI